MTERLQKIISAAGLLSRRAAETAIASGRVTVNGQTASLGDKADPDRDQIRLDGRPIKIGNDRVYLMLHKPRGVVTTLSDEKGRKCVYDLVKDLGVRVYPVGRLDLDSEGLLLMTNDGEFANRLMHPSHEVKKTYHTWVSGDVSEHCVIKLSSVTQVDNLPIRPAEVSLLRRDDNGHGVLAVTIHEGRNRQVRKMCESVGLKVERLIRVSEGCLKLGDLPSGHWRMLTEDEIRSFD